MSTFYVRHTDGELKAVVSICILQLIVSFIGIILWLTVSLSWMSIFAVMFLGYLFFDAAIELNDARNERVHRKHFD